MTRFAGFALALLLAFGLAVAQETQVNRFELFDEDGDGAIAMDEFRSALFDLLDENENDAVSEEEFKTCYIPDVVGRFDCREQPQAVFNRVDADHNNGLDEDEWMGAVDVQDLIEQAYNAFDRDDDGELDEEEFAAYASEAWGAAR